MLTTSSRFHRRPVFHALSMLTVAAAILSWTTNSARAAEENIPGKLEYQRSCAQCHGIGGHGDGPVAENLKVAPTDLTKLAANNDGRFPFLKVFQIVDGRTSVGAHGSQEMPVWGLRYKLEVAQTMPSSAMPGDMADLAIEQVVYGRILQVVNYIQMIQDPPLGEPPLIGESGASGNN
jgi:mono/diheme cytochrome c family protein